MNIELKSTTADDLAKEFQETIQTVQQEKVQEIQKASMSGNFQMVQKLNEELQKIIAQAQSVYEQRLSKITNGEHLSEENKSQTMSSPYSKEITKLDLDLTVYDGDRDYFIEFSEEQAIQEILNEIKEQHGLFASRKHLLKSSLRLTPVLAPNLYAIGNKCKEALGLNVDIEFYVYQNDMFNAACYPPDDKRLYIIVTSGLLERFTQDELTFVIGHEIGHAIFLHHEFPVNQLLDVGRNTLSPLHAMKLFAWKRNAEISADRIGMICCQDFEAAGSTFFKLSSGVTTSSLDFKLQEYIKQFVDLEKVINDSDIDPEDWYSSHPFSPLRIKALELFKDSETYFELIHQKGGKITEQKMEEEISKMMSLMEPSYINGESEHGALIQRFIFWGGYLITIADGKIMDEEIEALASIVNEDVYKRCINEVKGKDMDYVKNYLAEMSDDVNAVLSVMQKLNMLRDLAIISYADNEVDEEELNILYGLAYLLEINENFIDKIIDEAANAE